MDHQEIPEVASEPAGSAEPFLAADPFDPVEPVEAGAWLRRSLGRWIWHVHPGWLHLLDPAVSPDWLNLEHDARAEQVKTNDSRQVWYVRWGGPDLFVKINWPHRRWARWQRWLVGSPAIREWRVAQYAATHGVPTVRPVAVAEAPVEDRLPAGILITAAVVGARPLSEWWAGLEVGRPATRRLKNALIDAAARLIALAHQQGMEHFDLHAGNVLIQPRAEAFSAVFVDLPNIRVGRPVSDAAVIRNLAQFNQYFQLRGNLSDRMRFLDRYLHWREVLQPTSRFGRPLGLSRRALLNSLEEAVSRHARALYAQRDRRAMRPGRYFARLRWGDGWRGYAFLSAKHDPSGSAAGSLRLTERQWLDWLQTPGRLDLPADHRRVIKDSPTARIWRDEIIFPDGSCLPVICKRYIARDPLKALLHAVGRSRAMAGWQRGHALLNRQIPTARPLLVLERRRLGLLTDSLIVTECAEDASDLDTVLTVRLRELDPRQQRLIKDQIIARLAGLLRRLHERGFSHRDLKAPNVLVRWSPGRTDPFQVLLVDLDGLKLRRRIRPAHEAAALARLNVSLDHCRRVTLTDRVRFLRHYLSRLGSPDDDWRSWWKAVAALSEKKRTVRTGRQAKTLRRYGRL